MTKLLVDVDDEALEAAAAILGTKTKKDTINVALNEVSARLRRLEAFRELCSLAQSGRLDFEAMEDAWRRRE